MKSIRTFLIASFFFGCATSIPVPKEADLADYAFNGTNVTIEDLRADRELYIRKCSGCHGLYVPQQYSRTEWKAILPSMFEKSRLSGAERSQIERYLLLYSRR